MLQSLRPPESNQETSGLEPLSHTFAGPSRVDSIVPNCGAKESASSANFGLIFCRSIALLAPDSHRRHVCRCYAGTWLVSPRCTYHGRLGFARFRKGWRSLQGLNL